MACGSHSTTTMLRYEQSTHASVFSLSFDYTVCYSGKWWSTSIPSNDTSASIARSCTTDKRGRRSKRAAGEQTKSGRRQTNIIVHSEKKEPRERSSSSEKKEKEDETWDARCLAKVQSD